MRQRLAADCQNRCFGQSGCRRLAVDCFRPSQPYQETPMKKILTLALVACFACGAAFAADTKTDAKMAADTKMTPQQEKMKDCNDKAKDMKGDERKGF